MSFEISAVNAGRAARAPLERVSRPPAAGFGDALAHTQSAVHNDAIPASPPPEVVAEMFAAQRAVEDMHNRGRELHFAMESGRLRIELRDLDGNVLKQIPPSHALEIASGRAVV